jgi:hypothetical protein
MGSQSQQPELAGVVGLFSDPHRLVQATEKVRSSKYKHFDAYTPYPIHGLDAAQGLTRSFLPFVTFAAGITGCTLGFLLQYWTSAVDWPINVGGKPFNSWPAFVPIMFECTILFAGLATAGAMFLINGLPNNRRKAFDPRITCDQFALMIETPPAGGQEPVEKFNETQVMDFLKALGAQEVRTVYTEGWF